ncbi:hypothetical protein O181_057875 [Austropuccinia psidii MF-1]|uniref:Uncharacterized protein n=1 Tax=Austropuccinia psidii MF-1 TaxID=1389203 RepID=A0A9Q3E8L6_9BASI|nr:hypothetical protein [Austropuccinia psidii MF-1]
MKSLGIFETTVIFPHINRDLRTTVEFVVMENCSSTHFILGNYSLLMYGIDLHNNTDRLFTTVDNNNQEFAFLPLKRQITVNEVSPVKSDVWSIPWYCQNKAAEVQQEPIPQDQEEIQSLLGFERYYRKHIEDFASIARPLDKLCYKDTVFEMIVYSVKAFESLRQALITALPLLMPDFKLPFKLYIDESGD